MELGVSQFFRDNVGSHLYRGRLRPYLLFALFGLLWIFLSDRALLSLNIPADMLELTLAQTLKGMAFVLIAAVFFFYHGKYAAQYISVANRNLAQFGEITTETYDIVWRCDRFGTSFEVLYYAGGDSEEASRSLGEGAVHPDDHDSEWRAWAIAFEEKAPLLTSVRLRVNDGYRHFENRAFPMLDEDGEIVEWFGACRDIEDFVNTQEALNRNEEVLRLAAEAGGIGVWDWDLERDTLHVSAEMQRQHGAEIGRPAELKRFIRREDYPAARKVMLAAKYHAQPYEVEYRIETADGETRWILNKGAAYRGRSAIARRMLGVSVDITGIKEAENRYRFLAFHDGLTRTPNRRSGKNFLVDTIAACSEQNQVAVAIIDIDYFSRINESYGQDIGDWILRETARRIKSELVDDEYLCRYAADAFMVIKPATTAVVWAQRLQSLQAVCEAALIIDGIKIFMSISAGVARFPEHGRDAPAILRSAQSALYRAKTSGRGRVMPFEAEMLNESLRFEAIRNALKSAVSDNELSLHFQPQFSLRDDSLYGFEALVRWQSASLGVVSPAEFIPVAERVGMIGEIDAFIIQTVARQVNQWCEQGREPGRIGYNLSPALLEREGSADDFHAMIQARGLSASRLLLEITETAVIHEAAMVQVNLDRLSALGYAVALDDFGTGYSSLENLACMQLDKIKIDKSLTQAISDSERQALMVRGIIRMAHDMGIQVVAEGVETEEQLHRLIEWGCDIVQGYLYARPVPAEEAERFLRWHCAV